MQILYNLLSNAIKFTPADGSVRLSWTAQPATVAIAVRDTGIGIAPEDQERVFAEFQQVDSALGRVQQGTGLGLALTRRLVELHGGTLSLGSALGQGSTFTVTLPRVLADAQHVPSVQGQLGEVLVVEDNGAAFELLSLYLGEAGYGVQQVQRVAEVVPRARVLQPVAITLDILLREETGVARVEGTPGGPQTRDIPVVIISILGRASDRLRPWRKRLPGQTGGPRRSPRHACAGDQWGRRSARWEAPGAGRGRSARSSGADRPGAGGQPLSQCCERPAAARPWRSWPESDPTCCSSTWRWRP